MNIKKINCTCLHNFNQPAGNTRIKIGGKSLARLSVALALIIFISASFHFLFPTLARSSQVNAPESAPAENINIGMTATSEAKTAAANATTGFGTASGLNQTTDPALVINTSRMNAADRILAVYDFEGSREENASLPQNFYLRSTLDTEDADNELWHWNAVSEEEKFSGNPSLFYDLDISKHTPTGHTVYSKTTELNETGFIEITFYYKPKFLGHRANIGFEIFLPDDEWTIAIGLTDARAASSGADFNVTTSNLDNGWKRVLAATNAVIPQSKLRLFIGGIPYADDFNSSFFIDDISIRLIK